MIKQTYTVEELINHVQPTERYDCNLWCFDETEFFDHLGRDYYDLDSNKFSDIMKDRVKEYPIMSSYCTDTIVGLNVYVMDGVITWSTYQVGRKMDINLWIHNKEKYQELLDIAESCWKEKDKDVDKFEVTDLPIINHPVFVYEFDSDYVGNEGKTVAYLDNASIIRKLVNRKRHPTEYFGAVITYIDGNGDEITKTVDDAKGVLVGFKFTDADMIAECINQPIKKFTNGKEIFTQWGECKWVFKDSSEAGETE